LGSDYGKRIIWSNIDRRYIKEGQNSALVIVGVYKKKYKLKDANNWLNLSVNHMMRDFLN
jgi:hypothetical protein